MTGARVQIIPVRESYGLDFWVYYGDRLIRVCPSIDMARAVAAGYGGATHG